MFAVLAIVFAGSSVADAAGTVTNCASYGSTGTPGTVAWALVGGNTVTFACSGTIVVPEIVLGQDTLVNGTGRAVTLSGNQVNRVLNVSNGVTAELRNITVANGYSDHGGGIANYGTLTATIK